MNRSGLGMLFRESWHYLIILIIVAIYLTVAISLSNRAERVAEQRQRDGLQAAIELATGQPRDFQRLPPGAYVVEFPLGKQALVRHIVPTGDILLFIGGLPPDLGQSGAQFRI